MLEIIRIHNELLGTYGDQGNAEVLVHRAKLAKIKARITDISFEEKLPTTADMYLLGGAEDAAQILSAGALLKGSLLNKAVTRGATVLAICAGFQILGNSFVAKDEIQKGIGLLDVETVSGAHRLVGDISISSDLFDVNLTGFENHAGHTKLNSGAKEFGRLVVGGGNGIAGVDGAISGNVFGTYLHGPVLARNPQFADLLIARASNIELSEFPKIIDPLADQYAQWRRSVVR